MTLLRMDLLIYKKKIAESGSCEFHIYVCGFVTNTIMSFENIPCCGNIPLFIGWKYSGLEGINK